MHMCVDGNIDELPSWKMYYFVSLSRVFTVVSRGDLRFIFNDVAHHLQCICSTIGNTLQFQKLEHVPIPSKVVKYFASRLPKILPAYIRRIGLSIFTLVLFNIGSIFSRVS